MHSTEALEWVRRAFPASDEGLEAVATILELQLHDLASQPPPAVLPDAVRVAAASRLASGDVVIPRLRTPLEPARTVPLLRRLSRALVPDRPELEDEAPALLGETLPRILADDGRGVAEVIARASWPVETGASLLREALKPELLRTSSPFHALVAERAKPAGTCPLCGELPCAGTLSTPPTLLCRWCGTTWAGRVDPCPACGKAALHDTELAAVAPGSHLLACRECGFVLKLFPTCADPLVLSLCGILAAPFELAARVRLGAQPSDGFSVF